MKARPKVMAFRAGRSWSAWHLVRGTVALCKLPIPERASTTESPNLLRMLPKPSEVCPDTICRNCWRQYGTELTT